jgi:hypothetical protein
MNSRHTGMFPFGGAGMALIVLLAPHHCNATDLAVRWARVALARMREIHALRRTAGHGRASGAAVGAATGTRIIRMPAYAMATVRMGLTMQKNAKGA